MTSRQLQCAFGCAHFTVTAALAQPPRAVPLVIDHVNVVDVRSGRILADQAVVIEGRLIRRIGDAGVRREADGARVMDASGLYLIPGLWDMHVHLGPRTRSLPLLIANGVTGVRDMGGNDPDPPSGNFSVPFDSIDAWRRAIAQGSLIGPRIVAAGRVLDGPRPWPGTLGVPSAAAAEMIVDSLVRARVDFIKITGGMPREIFAAVARAARSKGRIVAGHVPNGVTLADAVAAGLASVEHLTGIPPACQPDCAVAAALLQRRQVAVVPTLAAWEGRLTPEVSPTMNSAGAYVSDAQRVKWKSIAPDPSAATRDTRASQLSQLLSVTHALHHSGVRILAGTDAMVPNTVHGFSLHRELQLLVQAGLSPLAALRAATVSAAEFLGVADSLGAIETGYIADLVLIRGDPLGDIRRTGDVAGVVMNGRLITERERQALLEGVRGFVRSESGRDYGSHTRHAPNKRVLDIRRRTERGAAGPTLGRA